MKKTLLVVAAVLALVAVLGVTGYAFAQTPAPDSPFSGPWQGGMMGGYGRMGGPGVGGPGVGGMHAAMHGADGGYGPMHEYMLQALAEKLGLTTEELQARLDSGETMWDVALAQGLSEAEVGALMTEAHNQALEAAVAAGVISPEQAEWMNSHMQQMHGEGFSGGCHGGTPQNKAPTGSEL